MILKDTADVLETKDTNTNLVIRPFKAGQKANPGYVDRNELIADQESVELCGNLHLDLSSSDKYLANNNSLTFALTKNDVKFILKSDDASVAEKYSVIYEEV